MVTSKWSSSVLSSHSVFCVLARAAHRLSTNTPPPVGGCPASLSPSSWTKPWQVHMISALICHLHFLFCYSYLHKTATLVETPCFQTNMHTEFQPKSQESFTVKCLIVTKCKRHRRAQGQTFRRGPEHHGLFLSPVGRSCVCWHGTCGLTSHHPANQLQMECLRTHGNLHICFYRMGPCEDGFRSPCCKGANLQWPCAKIKKGKKSVESTFRVITTCSKDKI